MKLEDVKELLTNPDFAYYLHGTGRGDNGYQSGVISSIFEKGLRASHGAMYWTTVCYGTGEDVKNGWNEMVNDMNHWKHLDSKNIIIVRFPLKYLIRGADDSLGEKDYAIYNEITNPETEQVTRFINPKMVVGCYNATSGEFLVNPNFEKDLSPETEKVLQEKYDEGVEAFNQRISMVSEPSSLLDKKDTSSLKEQDLEPVDQDTLDSLWLDFE